MSVPSISPQPQSQGQPPGRDPVVAVLLILMGLPLLLPGVCGYAFSSMGQMNPLAAIGLGVGFIGLVMIGFGIRRVIWRPRATSPLLSESAKRNVLLILLVIFVIFGVVIAALLRGR